MKLKFALFRLLPLLVYFSMTESQASSQMVRDPQGVPMISADTMKEALILLGKTMASDRMLQMDIARKYTQGRLSELLAKPGPNLSTQDQIYNQALLNFDIKQRMASVHLLNQEILPSLSPIHQGYLNAFTQGVNAWIREQDEVPLRYKKLGVQRIEPWQAVDSLDAWDWIGGLFGGDDSENELIALKRCETGLCNASLCENPPPIDESAAQANLPLDPGFAWHQSSRISPYDFFAPEIPTLKASHAWAVSGTHTDSGKPYLAYDPQLKVTAPSPFYPAVLTVGSFSVRALLIPGAISGLIFFNHNLGQTVTSSQGNPSDLYEIHITDPDHYEYGGESVPFQTRQEIIRAKDGTSTTIQVRRTVHGFPIETPVNQSAYFQDRLFVKKTSHMQVPGRHTMLSAFEAMRASSLEELRSALNHWTTPIVNAVQAGQDFIQYLYLGPAINRPVNVWEGVNRAGSIPYDGRYPSNEWIGFLPVELRPHRLNPPEGFILSANHLVIGNHYPSIAKIGLPIPGETLRSDILRNKLRPLVERGSVTFAEVNALHFDTSQIALETLRDMLSFSLGQGWLGTPIAPDQIAISRDEKAQKTLFALNLWITQGGSQTMSSPYWELNEALQSGPTSLPRLSRFDAHPITACRWSGGEGGVVNLMKAFRTDTSVFTLDEFELIANAAALSWDAMMSKAYPENPLTWTARTEMTHVTYQDNFICGVLGLNSGVDCNVDMSAEYDARIEQHAATTLASFRGKVFGATVNFANPNQSVGFTPPGISEDPASPRYNNLLRLWIELSHGRSGRVPKMPLETPSQ